MFDQPMYWTRVKNVEQAVNQRVTIFDVEEDLQADKSLKQIRKGSVRNLGTILFYQETFKDLTDQLTIANH